MDENEQKAYEIFKRYMENNKKITPLNDKVRDIVETKLKAHEYFEYTPSEIKAELAKEGLDFNDLPDTLKKIEEEDKAGFFIPFNNSGYCIIIRKEIPEEYIICAFIHEFCHYQYNLGDWQDKKPVDRDIEHEKCEEHSEEYADKKGFLSKYGEIKDSLFKENSAE